MQVFPNGHIAPGTMVANTDTKHYLDLTNNVYRWVCHLNLHTSYQCNVFMLCFAINWGCCIWQLIIMFTSRFTPAFTMKSDISRFHGYDERISKANYIQVVEFYYRIIKNADLFVIDKDFLNEKMNTHCLMNNLRNWNPNSKRFLFIANKCMSNSYFSQVFN